MQARAEVDEPRRRVHERGQQVGRQDVGLKYVLEAVLGLDAAGLAVADTGVVDDRVEDAGRVGEVSDIAEAFVYLMRNGYSSGTMVTVDGGSVLV